MGYTHPKVIYTDDKADRKDSILRYIANRVFNNNKNFLCALTGQTGIGKSWGGGSICEKWEKAHNVGYDPRVHTFFSLRELLELVNKEDGTIKNGSILMFDESQIDVNARAWQSEANQIMSALVSTFRHLRLVVLFPTPKLEFLDKQTRLLFHAEFKVLGFDKATKMTKIEPRFLTDFNHRKNDFYRKRLIVNYKIPGKKRYGKYMVQDWSFLRPSNEWVEIYEAKKEQFSRELRASLLEKINKGNKSKKEEKAEGFLKFAKLYNEIGEDYVKLNEEFPDKSVFALEKWAQFIKRKNRSQGVVTVPTA